MKKLEVVIFLLYLVLGLYFLNFPINYVAIPEYVSVYNNWIIFVGGIFIIFGGINLLRLSSKKKHSE